MKRTNIYYWICTGLMIVSLGIGSFLEIISYPASVQIVTRLGYPEYLVPFLGVARLLALVVILMPVTRFSTLREWAYAGIVFDLIGALYSHIAFGDPVSDWIGILIIAISITGSYIFYHKKLRIITQTAT